MKALKRRDEQRLNKSGNTSIRYFDNAATSFPKPVAVTDEVNRCICEYCGNPGRSSHSLSVAASEKIYECRCEIASLFGGEPENVVFTENATYSLNIAIKSFLPAGAHVLISDIEHNSVYRPVTAMADSGLLTFDVFGSFGGNREKILEALEIKCCKNTRAIICTGDSNICGISLPVRSIGEFCKRKGILFILDASQSAGHRTLNLKADNIDILCAPGHKALFGIQGCGFFITGGKPVKGKTFIEGGSGVDSLSRYMPDAPPERYEGGTLPTPAIAALCEGIKFVRKIGTEEISGYEKRLGAKAADILSSLPSVHLYGNTIYSPVISFTSDKVDNDRLAALLDKGGFCVRSGYHCSPLAHKTIGSIGTGTVRMSLGIFNTEEELSEFYVYMKSILAGNI